uniref:Uncharacterized protein n=1 Tax=viral metagenome TaxID=1070528 RepID=A0A6M3KTK2_9ZZZZ
MNNINRFIGVDLANPTLLTFFLDKKEVGRLIVRDDKLEFVGDAYTSTQAFLNGIKPIVDNYIKEKLDLLN